MSLVTTAVEEEHAHPAVKKELEVKGEMQEDEEQDDGIMTVYTV